MTPSALVAAPGKRSYPRVWGMAAALCVVVLTAILELWLIVGVIPGATTDFPDLVHLVVPGQLWVATAATSVQAAAATVFIGLSRSGRSNRGRFPVWAGWSMGLVSVFLALIVGAYIALSASGLLAPGIVGALFAAAAIAVTYVMASAVYWASSR